MVASRNAVEETLVGNRSLRRCEKMREIAVLTDESVCPTLLRKRSRLCGTGAFACQPIFSQLLIDAALSSFIETLLAS
jgi:hypothetical protein